MSCRPFTGDHTRPSPRLPPSPNSKHRIGTYEKDGALVTTEELVPWLREHWAPVRQALDAGTYRPSPARRVVIPKPGGGERLLGVPTCPGRLIQQAIAQVLTPVFDPGFSGSSFGFRPGRPDCQAVRVARRCIADGLVWVADIDLDRFSGRVQLRCADGAGGAQGG